MDLAAIGAMSIDMSMSNLQQSVNISVMKGAMEVQQTQATALIESIQSMPVSFGHRLDMYI